MKKFSLIFVLFLIIFILKANAQSSNVGIGPELNIPSGNASNITSIGYGGGVKLEIGLSSKFALTFNGSYINFAGNGNSGLKGSVITAVPLKAGFKHYTSKSFYVEGQVGSNVLIKGSGHSGLAWSPGIGALIKTKNSEDSFDVGLRYESWTGKNDSILGSSTSTFAFIGLRVAYAFNL
jgi:hypothetical protein